MLWTIFALVLFIVSAALHLFDQPKFGAVTLAAGLAFLTAAQL